VGPPRYVPSPLHPKTISPFLPGNDAHAVSRRVEKVVGYPPLLEMSAEQRQEFHEALLEADSFEICLASGRRPSLSPSRTGRSCGLSAATERHSVGPSISVITLAA
jgi:hypothetical protein